MRFIFAFIFLLSYLQAEELNRLPSENPLAANEGGESSSTRIFIRDLKGIVLVGNEEALLNEEELKNREGISTHCLSLPGNLSSLQKKLEPYLGRSISQETLYEIKVQIHTFFQINKQPFILIFVPKQRLGDVLQLVILKAKLGEVSVEGNRYFSSKTLLQYVKTKPGEEINVASLQRDLYFMNRNPFRQVNMIYAPGKEKGTTDLVLAASDRRPYRFYAGADNSGIKTINRQRLYTGFSCGKVLGIDQVFAYQYTTSYDFNDFQAHTGQWIVFFPWEHLFTAYGGYSSLHLDNPPFPTMRTHGRSVQASGRYTIPFGAGMDLIGENTIGFDFKRTNNTVEFSEVFINFSQNVNLSQFVYELKVGKEWKRCRLEFTGDVFYSPGDLLPDESNADYEALRPGAKNTWVYGRASIRYTQRLPMDFALMFWARGQYSSDALLPSEQLGIGGFDTVRGYDENQLTMDNGFIGNFEMRTLPIQMISYIRRFPMKDALQFLVFFDYGIGSNHAKLPGEPSHAYLMSAGPGIRYTLDPYFTARLDWGIKLHKKSIYTGGDSMVQFNATLSY